jgi:predicted metal-dependent phosphoesterase TrpH
MSIDLHTHSSFSDGTMSPTELVEFARQKGLRAIALTDHDTCEGVAEAVEAGRRFDIEVIPGIELSVHFEQQSVHLLGYFIDPASDCLERAVNKIQNGRSERNLKILGRLNELGFKGDEAEVAAYGGIGQVGRPHFARMLIDRGWASSMDQAFDDYLGKTGRAYFSRFSFSLGEAVRTIHAAGGLCSVAHPAGLVLSPTGDLKGEVLRGLVAGGIDGIEVYYPTHTKKFRKKLISFAQANGLIMTGGSDYHGDIRPGTTLAGGKNVSVPYALLTAMKEYRNKKMSHN